MTALVLSGNEITDALRALGVQGDGRAVPDSSMGIWPAATNLITNGGFETNLTGWTTLGGAVLTRITTDFKFGAACCRVATPAAASSVIGWMSFASPGTGITATVSVWLKGTVGKLVHLNLSDSLTDTNSPTITLSAVWTRYALTKTWGGPSGSFFRVYTDDASGGDVLVDGAQLELGSVATPYIETDGGTAARAAARVQVPVAGLFTGTQGWVAARVRMGWVNTADPSANPTLFQWKDDANNLLELRYDTTANQWELQRRNTAGTGESTKADTFALSDLVTVIAAWDSANLKVSIDGSAFVSVAATNIPTLAAASADIGSAAGTAEHIAGDILWFAAGSGTLTDADAAAIHAFGNTDPTIGALPGSAKMVWAADTSAYTLLAASVAAVNPNTATWKNMKSKLAKLGFAANVIIGDPTSPPEQFTMAIVPNNGQVDETTLTYTRDVHRVIVRCYADRLAESAEETEFKLDEIRDKIAIDFFGDFDLGGTVAYAIPTEFAWEYDYVEVGARRYRVLDVMFAYRVDDRAAFVQ